MQSHGPLVHALGGYREHAPPRGLATVCESVWTHTTPWDAELAPGTMHRVLPDPSLNLAFACDRGADGRPRAARLVVIGPKTRPSIFAFHAGFELAAVKLRLEWSAPLLGLESVDHTDTEIDAAPLLPGLAEPLLDRLRRTRNAGEALSTLLTTLAAEAWPRTRPAAAASWALDEVRRRSGRLSVEDVAERIGFSGRHLRRTVREASGVSLKHYARTLRLLAAITAADAAARPAWARIAADFGFCDQPHLVRECRQLCRLPPSQVHRERRAEPVAETSKTAQATTATLRA